MSTTRCSILKATRFTVLYYMDTFGYTAALSDLRTYVHRRIRPSQNFHRSRVRYSTWLILNHHGVRPVFCDAQRELHAAPRSARRIQHAIVLHHHETRTGLNRLPQLGDPSFSKEQVGAAEENHVIPQEHQVDGAGHVRVSLAWAYLCYVVRQPCEGTEYSGGLQISSVSWEMGQLAHIHPR